MWVARNELVHHDGETRDTLIIQDLNRNIKRLQKEGAKCRNLFRDDRKFFKTPYWKLKLKTEQQKIRFIETANQLMEDSRKAAQQTLDIWRIEEDSTDSDSTDDNDDKSQGRTGGEELRPPNLQPRKKQTHLADFFRQAELTNTTTSMNGTSSDNQGASSDERGEDRSLEIIDQSTAGWVQPSADLGQPSAGLARPSARSLRPSTELDTTANNNNY